MAGAVWGIVFAKKTDRCLTAIVHVWWQFGQMIMAEGIINDVRIHSLEDCANQTIYHFNINCTLWTDVSFGCEEASILFLWVLVTQRPCPIITLLFLLSPSHKTFKYNEDTGYLTKQYLPFLIRLFLRLDFTYMFSLQ